MTGRRGFTLIEVLVVLVVSSILAALVFTTVARVHQLARGRAERAGLETALRNALLPIAADLESAGADSIAGLDLAALASQSVTLRAGRGLLLVCGLALPDTIVVDTAGARLWALRAPVPVRDSLLLYLPGDSTGIVDGWLPLPLVAGPFPASCPGGAPGWRLVAALDTATARLRRVASPTVLRLFETVAYRLYPSTLGWQIGQEGLSAGAAVQPLAGPFTALGLDLQGLASVLTPAAGLPSIASIRVAVTAPGHRESAVGPGIAPASLDSLAWLAPLRNVP